MHVPGVGVLQQEMVGRAVNCLTAVIILRGSWQRYSCPGV